MTDQPQFLMTTPDGVDHLISFWGGPHEAPEVAPRAGSSWGAPLPLTHKGRRELTFDGDWTIRLTIHPEDAIDRLALAVEAAVLVADEWSAIPVRTLVQA